MGSEMCIRDRFISDHKNSFLEIVSTDFRPQVEVVYKKEKGKDRKKEILSIENFIAIKGAKSMGNRLSSNKVNTIKLLEPLPYTEEIVIEEKINLDIPLTITNNEDNNQTALEL